YLIYNLLNINNYLRGNLSVRPRLPEKSALVGRRSDAGAPVSRLAVAAHKNQRIKGVRLELNLHSRKKSALARRRQAVDRSKKPPQY
ncbi:MAG: hypothetical protein QMD17_14300, partial [Rhodocyclaceae bacterium]|nr:hypothetical protein [Rhodocyclaceae bacterium]